MIWQHRAYRENAFAENGGWFRPPSAGRTEAYPMPVRSYVGQAPTPTTPAPAATASVSPGGAVSIFVEPKVLGVPLVPALLVLGGLALVVALAGKK